ncbi:MAG: DUF6799 domain-containing protein [Burkholderiaceae bacterium]
MKKLILIAALTLSTGIAMAQTTHKDSVMMKDHKMMMMKDGKTMPMDKDMMMSDGSKVMMDGTVMKKDGSKMMMKDGDAMDMSGMMMKK